MSGVTLLALVEESFVAAGALAPLPAKTAQTAKANWTILIEALPPGRNSVRAYIP
jgi:hypothetical protein